MAENDNPGHENKADAPGHSGDNPPAKAQGHGGAIGGQDDKGVHEEKKDKPGNDAPDESGKGINPVQHSE